MDEITWKIIDTQRDCCTGHGDESFRSLAQMVVDFQNSRYQNRYQLVDTWLAEAYRKLDALREQISNDSADFVGAQHQRLEALIQKR